VQQTYDLVNSLDLPNRVLARESQWYSFATGRVWPNRRSYRDRQRQTCRFGTPVEGSRAPSRPNLDAVREGGCDILRTSSESVPSPLISYPSL
jgi:hypothetical protein